MRTMNTKKPNINTKKEAAGSGDNGSARLGRRSFLKRISWGGTVLVPGAGWLASGGVALADPGGHLTRGDVAILRFLAAAEILETDLWQQYNEVAGVKDEDVPGGSGIPAFTEAVAQLDED